MPDLPERADIVQLRRQARELLRAAVAGEPGALARLSAVSARPTLAAAQLAIAREHGFRSWPALRSEAEGRRQAGASYPPPRAGQQEAQDVTPGRRSFGSAGAITVEEGELITRILMIGPEGAILEASLVEAEAIAHTLRERLLFPELRDVTVTDDQGATSALECCSGHGPESAPRPRYEVSGTLDPVPGSGARWLDVHGQGTSVTRLRPSDPVPARVRGLSPVTDSPAERELRNLVQWVLLGYLSNDVRDSPELKRRCRNALARAAKIRESLADGSSPLPGQFTRLCASLIRQRPPAGLPGGWLSVLNAADRADGPGLHLDIDTVLPSIDGTTVRLNTLASWPDSWDLYLQAWPGWWTHSTDGQHKRAAMSVSAEDDLGGMYISNFGGSSGRPGYEELKLTLRPRLNPRASLLVLAFAGETQQVSAEVPLAP